MKYGPVSKVDSKGNIFVSQHGKKKQKTKAL